MNWRVACSPHCRFSDSAVPDIYTAEEETAQQYQGGGVLVQPCHKKFRQTTQIETTQTYIFFY